MKNRSSIIAFVTSMLLVTSVQSQITKLSNQPGTNSPEYVGWNGEGDRIKHLDIENKFAVKDIRFWINDAGSGTTTTEKMIFLEIVVQPYSASFCAGLSPA